MSLTTEVLASIESSVLCWLATIDESGSPSVSPKEVFAALGDHLVIAHIASPGSVRNIEGNPKVCASMIDVFEQRGHKLYGMASLAWVGTDEYAAWVPPLEAITQGAYPIKAVIRVEVERIEPILAPSYFLYPDVSATDRRAATLRTYGVTDDPS